MKRVFSLLLALFAWIPLALPVHAATLFSGDLIKASGSTVYYYANNGKRYVFPTEKTYTSWYANFSEVKTITDTELALIPLGGNVTYRPGTRLVKITTDPKVYAVAGMRLHWVTSEELATALFGANWATQVDDLPDPFFVNYTLGTPITSAAEYLPSSVRDAYPSFQTVLAENDTTPPVENPEPPAPTEPTNNIPLTLTANKTEAQVYEQIVFLAQTTTLAPIDRLEIFQGDGNRMTSCNATACSTTWAVPSANLQPSYTFRAKLTLQDGQIKETTVTIPIVSMPLSSLIRITSNRLVIKPEQYPDLRANVESGLAAARTDIFINGVSVKACTVTPYDCPYNDYLLGGVGTTFDIYAVVQTVGQLFYKSPTVRITVAENDTPLITLTPSRTSVFVGESFSLTLQAADDDGVSRTEIISNGQAIASCEGPVSCSVNTGPWNVSSGTVLTFTARAWDLKNAESSATLNVTIQ